jgi:signal transduction histidine kinase
MQVFNNLIKNAVQSIPSDRKGKVEISLEQTEKSIEIRVSDNGNGISKENQDKMFVPNFTTKVEGTGLGLAISKNIIEQLGGTIRFESEVGQGTVFVVEIPMNL